MEYNVLGLGYAPSEYEAERTEWIKHNIVFDFAETLDDAVEKLHLQPYVCIAIRSEQISQAEIAILRAVRPIPTVILPPSYSVAEAHICAHLSAIQYVHAAGLNSVTALRGDMKRTLTIIFTVLIVLCLGFSYLYKHGLSGIHHPRQPHKHQIKIACIGDSITYGHGISNWPENSYPAVLQKLLGDDYHVQNFGVSGSAVQDASDQPYRETAQYRSSLDYDADLIVFMIGSNDTKPENWFGEEAFAAALEDLLDDYTENGRPVSLYLCTTPACYFVKETGSELTNFGLRPAYVDITAEIVRQTAIELGYPLIDIHDLTGENPVWFEADGVHPDAAGAAAIAQAVYTAISESA